MGQASGASSAIDVIAVERGIGAQGRQNGAHERRVVEQFGRNAFAGAATRPATARRQGAGGGTWLRRYCGARAPEAISSAAAAGRAAAAARASSNATTAPMLWPKKAKGCARYGSMASASAATSGAMRSNGASARRDSRPGRRTGTMARERAPSARRRRRPRAGNQNRRGPSTASAPGNQAAARRPLAQPQRQQAAPLGRESLRRPGRPWRPRPRLPRTAPAAQSLQQALERLDGQVRGIRQRRARAIAARSPRNARGPRAAAPAPRATGRCPAAALRPPAPSARPAAAGTSRSG